VDFIKITIFYSSNIGPKGCKSASQADRYPFSPFFQEYPQSKEILLNLGMKCWKSAFNAQGSRLIIVALQLGAVKIYAARLEALKKKERQGETKFTTKTEVPPPLNVNVFYFFESHPICDQTLGSSVVFLTS
jgi:hypothetical protein